VLQRIDPAGYGHRHPGKTLATPGTTRQHPAHAGHEKPLAQKTGE
jgi:hypothetical protein